MASWTEYGRKQRRDNDIDEKLSPRQSLQDHFENIDTSPQNGDDQCQREREDLVENAILRINVHDSKAYTGNDQRIGGSINVQDIVIKGGSARPRWTCAGCVEGSLPSNAVFDVVDNVVRQYENEEGEGRNKGVA